MRRKIGRGRRNAKINRKIKTIKGKCMKWEKEDEKNEERKWDEN